MDESRILCPRRWFPWGNRAYKRDMSRVALLYELLFSFKYVNIPDEAFNKLHGELIDLEFKWGLL